MSAVQVNTEKQNIVERKPSTSDSSSVLKQTNAAEAEKGPPQPEEDVEETKEHSWTSYERLRPFILLGIALLILGWWISSIVLPATRHRWFVFQSRFMS
jgi:CNT family concentrative nucleoside transporter